MTTSPGESSVSVVAGILLVLPLDVRRTSYENAMVCACFFSSTAIDEISLRVIEKQVDGLFNVGSGQSRTSLEVARILVKAMKADEKCIKVHAADNLLSSTGFPALDIRKAREAFGFSPLTLEDGLLLMLLP